QAHGGQAHGGQAHGWQSVGTGPEAILFNGGGFPPQVLRDRAVGGMRSWFNTPAAPWQPLVLTNPSPGPPVPWGPGHYRRLRHTGGRRIGGGIARSYYITVAGPANGERVGELESESVEELEGESAAPSHSPTLSPSHPPTPSPSHSLTLLCVVPQHLEEGQ